MIHLHNTNVGIPGTVLTNIPVPASTMVVIDSVPEQFNRSIKWIVTAINLTTNDMQAFELLALNKFGLTASHTKYASIGDKINILTDVNIVLGNMELQITNNEISPLLINIVRIQSLA